MSTSGTEPRERQVLIAVDGSAVSERAAVVARSLFGERARYSLVHVGKSDTHGFMRGIAERVGMGDAALVEMTGESAEGIAKTAHELDADVVVLGSRDRGWFARLVSPSTARHVTEAADRPVLIVKDAPPAPSARSPLVLVATDGAAASLHAARAAATLFGAEARFEVVHVAQLRPDPNVDATGMAPSLMTDEEADAIERESLASAADFVAEAASALAPLDAATTILQGDPVVQLSEHARANDAHVLVVGSTGGTRLLHVLVGSTSSQLLTHCDVPLLVVPAELA